MMSEKDERLTSTDRSPHPTAPPTVLMVDVGGTSVKMMVSGQEGFRKVKSSRSMTAAQMVARTLKATKDWKYDVVSLGFPGLIRNGQVARNPLNLGGEWEGFDFEKAFRCPVRLINDAAMQALANYETGRLLFVGLGTSVGACLIVDDVIVPVEVGLLRLSKSEGFMDRLSKEALNKGRARWQKAVERALALLRDLFWPDHVVIGGGNAKHLDPLPEGCERTNNQEGFRGAIRLWGGADMVAVPHTTTWRIHR
jgi:polyphosphate glucokinase